MPPVGIYNPCCIEIHVQENKILDLCYTEMALIKDLWRIMYLAFARKGQNVTLPSMTVDLKVTNVAVTTHLQIFCLFSWIFYTCNCIFYFFRVLILMFIIMFCTHNTTTMRVTEIVLDKTLMSCFMTQLVFTKHAWIYAFECSINVTSWYLFHKRRQSKTRSSWKWANFEETQFLKRTRNNRKCLLVQRFTLRAMQTLKVLKYIEQLLNH